MRRSRPGFFNPGRFRYLSSSAEPQTRPPLIRIQNGTFYRRQPSTTATNEESITNKPLFPNLDFTFETDHTEEKKYCAIIGPSNAGKTTFLEILRGQHLCFPPTARSYPYLSTEEVARKDPRLRYEGRSIAYVGFNVKDRGLSGLGSYLSARYESRREVTDFSLLDYLKGKIQLNADEPEAIDDKLFGRVVADLNLGALLDMPVSNLSNGQTRRARIAKALLGRPELLLLDEPFMGLDPETTLNLSKTLWKMAKSDSPRLFLALRPQDPIPRWINFLMVLGQNLQVSHQGSPQEVAHALKEEVQQVRNAPKSEDPKEMPNFYSEFGQSLDSSIYKSVTRVKMSKGLATEIKAEGKVDVPLGEPIVEMNGVVVKYGDRTILGDWHQITEGKANEEEGLFWTVRRGERWGLFGPNGSGKTTLLSMITSDHPQAYSAPMKLFGRSRLPQPGVPGLSIFELQSKIGHSSPEVHAFFPRSLSVRATLESAYADTPLSRPVGLTAETDRRIDACLRWFQSELNPAIGMNRLLKEELLRRRNTLISRKKAHTDPGNSDEYKEARELYLYEQDIEQLESVEWADRTLFGELPFSAQRVALFLRAIIKSPDLVILDEAFSGLDDYVREKCMLFLVSGESMILSPYSRNSDEFAQYFTPIPRNKGDTRHIEITEGLTKNQALICISHVKEEVPKDVRHWLYLPESSSGKPARMAKLVGPTTIATTDGVWRHIWGVTRERFFSERYREKLEG